LEKQCSTCRGKESFEKNENVAMSLTGNLPCNRLYLVVNSLLSFWVAVDTVFHHIGTIENGATLDSQNVKLVLLIVVYINIQ
jgi:hypothetical protein